MTLVERTVEKEMIGEIVGEMTADEMIVGRTGIGTGIETVTAMVTETAIVTGTGMTVAIGTSSMTTFGHRDL